jgi:hypothetical protein
VLDPLRNRLPVFQVKTLFFNPPLKNRPSYSHSDSLSESGWDKLGGKNSFDLKAFGGLLMWCNSAVFWQMGHNNAPVSPCTETDGFTGFS